MKTVFQQRPPLLRRPFVKRYHLDNLRLCRGQELYSSALHKWIGGVVLPLDLLTGRGEEVWWARMRRCVGRNGSMIFFYLSVPREGEFILSKLRSVYAYFTDGLLRHRGFCVLKGAFSRRRAGKPPQGSEYYNKRRVKGFCPLDQICCDRHGNDRVEREKR